MIIYFIKGIKSVKEYIYKEMKDKGYINNNENIYTNKKNKNKKKNKEKKYKKNEKKKKFKIIKNK